MSEAPIRYVASLRHVREVSLLGAADLAYWQKRLASEDLAPAERDGQAQILVVAADARFWGLRFQELSFSVLVASPGPAAAAEAAFLVQAFNSLRAFAFCERNLFSTPYTHGEVELATARPASVRLDVAGQTALQVAMSADALALDEPAGHGVDGWEGPVILPTTSGLGAKRRKFFARIRGDTEVCPFRPGQDALLLQPCAGPRHPGPRRLGILAS